jgi:HEPN domain-containing protein
VNRKELRALAATRLKEAKILLGAGCPDGAYYLAGYAVECALKACIAKQTQRHDFPEKQIVIDSHTHDLTKLLDPAGLKVIHKAAMQQPEFANNWKTVTEWKTTSRYASRSNKKAEELLKAIGERKSGILTWLRRHY